MIGIKRVYEPPTAEDGTRVLVDRLWPRGMKRDAAAIDEWLKEIAPSNELRKWFDHDPSRWQEFLARYHKELEGSQAKAAIEQLQGLMSKGRVTLVYAAKDLRLNNAEALREILTGKSPRRG